MTIGALIRKQARLALVLSAIFIAFIAAIFPQGANPALGNAQVGDATSSVRTTTGGGGDWARDCPNGYVLAGSYLRPTTITEGFFTVYQVISLFGGNCIQVSSSGLAVGPGIHDMGFAGSNPNNNQESTHCGYSGASVAIGARVFKTPLGRASGLQFICRDLPDALASTERFLGRIGAASDGNLYEDIRCPTGTVARGLFLGESSIVERIGFRCGSITGATQTVSFGALSSRIAGEPSFRVSASTNGAGTLGYSSSTTDVCTTSGNRVSVLSAGTCTITATATSTTNWAQGSQAQSFTVQPAPDLPLSTIDYAISLDGVKNGGGFTANGEFLRTATSTGMRDGNTSLMIEAWVKPASVSTQNVVFAKNFSFLLRASTNGWILNAGNGSSWPTEVIGPPVALNQWSHVAVVVTASEHKLYINGGLVATAASGGHNDNTNVVSIGAYEDGNIPFHGEIDEVKIWVNKDGTHIPTTMHSRASPSDSNLQAYWDFNETSGTTALNRKPGSPNLVHQGNPNRVDVKQETTASNGETIITFPRTYLPGVGHWIAPEDSTNVRALVVAGGGSGASYVGGGGGGGGVLASTMSTFGSATYSIVVGQGGAPVGSLTSIAGRRAGHDGQNSSAFGLTPVGGGGGGFSGEASRAGGSGGGAGFFNNGPATVAGGSGVTGQGSSGGSSEPYRQLGGFSAGAGGGGAGESGESSNNALGRGGNGGAGTASAILDTQFFFGGGGGGGAYLPPSGSRGGHGGTGGGGAGGVLGANPVTANGGGLALNPGGSVTVGTDFAVAGSGGANTGGGGGGVGHDGISGAGGSGVVIVRYSMATIPTITSQPSDVSVTPGNAATLTVEASGNGTLSYQWEVSLDNGATWSVVGTNSDTYATSVFSSADSGGKYRVQVTNTNNGEQSLYSDVVTVRLVGVIIMDGPCYAKVGDPTGVSISFVSGGCLVEYSQIGSNTFTVPVNVTSVRAMILGAGGGGGAGLPGLRNGGGGGGGGGANSIVSIAVTASQEISITLGQGGAGGNNSDGGDGESSSILYGNSVSSTSVTASGGFGGQMSFVGGGRPGDGGEGRITEGGTGATHPAKRPFEMPVFGNACRDVSFASITYCIGGGGGGGNREVADDPFFDFAAGSIPSFTTTLVSGGTGGYHNQTNPVPATSGVPNRGGGGGGGAYDLEQNIGRTGAPGANGLVSFFYIPNAGEVSLSAVAPVSFSQATVPLTLTKENPSTDVTWTTSNTAVCTVTGDDSTGTVTQVAPGQCDVSVRVAASSSFGVGSANTSFRIDKINRPVAPSWIGTTLSVPFGGTSNLWTKISSPGTNNYRISISGTVGGCSVTGYTLSVGNVGSTCTVDLFHSGDDTYLERQATNQLSVTITKISQSQLVLTSGTAMSVNQTFQLSGAGGTGPGALTYHVANDGSTGCTISDPSSGEISGATSAGSCEVYAKRAASTNYDQVTSSHVLIAIAKIPQVLQWQSQPQAQYFSGDTYLLEATASSQLAVSYTISSGLCSLAGATVTFNGSGDCVVEAFQVGDGGYLVANTISQTVSVGKINQTMTFSAIANKVWGSLAFSLSATASSGLAISYSEDPQTTNDACDVSAQGIVTIKNLGRCAIAAAQAGDVSYTSIERVRVFEVTANQAGAPFIGSISFGDRSLTAGFFAPSYLGGGNISAYQLTAHNPDGTVAATNSGCVANPGPTQSCTVIGLQNGETYYLRVAAITQAGVGQLSVSTSMVVPASNPEAVGNLTAIEGNGTLTLNWSKPTSFGGGNFFQYRIYWKAPGQSYQPNGAPGHAIGFENSTSYVITGLQNGVAYDVKIITATSNNNLELQSNTAEVNQTPYTVPDAPASAVALENGNNLVIAWQAPVFDGGNPIDRYVVQKGGTTICTITSVSTTSCEVGMPSPGTSNIEVRAGNEAGLSQPAQTTFVVQSVAGSNQVVAGSGGVSLPGVTPNTPRPVVTDVSGSAVVSVNDLVRLIGTNMRLVEKILVGDVEASFFVNSDGLITIRVPVGVPAGKVVVTLSGAYGSVFFTDLFEVKTSLQSVDERVTIGTFLGYAAVYTKNHEGKRLSMRIGNKWRVVDPLKANYTRNLTRVGVGRTVTVMVYLDRKLVQVKQIKIR